MSTPRAPGGSRRWLAAGLALLVSLLVSVPIAQTQAPRLDLPPVLDPIPPELCGTDFEHLVSLGLAVPLALADGEALMFDQTPAILKPDQSGNFSIKVQLVGDLPTMRFERETSTTETPVIETWGRTGTRTVGGRIVSIFEKVYPDSELATTLRRRTWGFDNGGLYWGRVLLPNSETKPQLSLRIGSTNLPAATPVVRLSADVQYAGSVVNILIPGFGDTRVADGDHGFDLQAAAKKFYEFFPDSYDMIAFIPQNAALAAGYSAFHRRVKNEVTGIGSWGNSFLACM